MRPDTTEIRGRLLAGIGLLVLASAACRERGLQAPAPRDFRLATSYAGTSLDPHLGFVAGNPVRHNVYETLVVVDRDLAIRPCLASAWVNPDLLTWVFHLRRDVLFHDGRPLRAADVVWSIRRLLGDPSLDSAYYLMGVAGADAVDEFTVRVRTSRPVQALLGRLAFVYVVPEGAGSRELSSAATGTGPYRLASFTSGREVRLHRNERYWGPRPDIERATFLLGMRPESAAAELRRGALQFAFLFSEDFSVQDVGAGAEVVRQDSPHVFYLGFDLGRASTPFCPVRPNPFLDVRVRRAVHLALDRAAIAGVSPHDRKPASQLVPGTIFGFDPGIPVAGADPAAARDLLRRAGYPKGFPLTLHTRDRFKERASVLAAQLAVIGIAVDVRVLADSEYFAGIAARRFTMWLDNWGCTTGDAGELFESAMHSPDLGTGLGRFNETGYADRDLDRAIEASAAEEQGSRRLVALQGVMRSLMEKLVWIPLYTESELYVVDRTMSWRARVDLSVQLADFERRGSAPVATP